VNAAFKAVADATRRRILQLLRDRDLAAGDIAAEFDISWPSISHHLKVLREADLVLVERQGQELIYSLNTTVLQEFAAALLALLGVRGEESDEV
jgi:DNA-binding transcriptional ArsR family regulator